MGGNTTIGEIIDTSNRRLPGEEIIWVLIFCEMAMFAVIFAIFLGFRAQAVDVFQAAQQQLLPLFALVNTLVLLTSSWCVANGLSLFRQRRGSAAAHWLLAAALLGIAFTVIKLAEYDVMFSRGMHFDDNNFTICYFLLTGTHLTHVIVGVIVLLYFSRQFSVRGLTSLKPTTVEAGTSYWHMVDLLWIVLFALLYLLH